MVAKEKKTSELNQTSLSLLKIEKAQNYLLNKHKCLTKI